MSTKFAHVWIQDQGDGQFALRAIGPFAPFPRIVTIAVSTDATVQDMFEAAKAEYEKKGIPMEQRKHGKDDR